MVINATLKNEMLARACQQPAVFLSMEDDSSVRSTFTVLSPSTSKNDLTEQPIKSGSKRSRRSVHFQEDKNESFDNTQMCLEEINELWYSRLQFRDFRRATGMLGRAIANTERKIDCHSSFKNVLHSTLEACRQSTLDANEAEATILNLEAQQRLYRRLSESPDRLGLERMAVRKLLDERYHRRQSIRKLVLDLQKRLKQDVSVIGNNNFQDQHAELIRLRCLAISRPSRLFAKEIAQAYAAHAY